jgi:hypothetical protein
MIRENSLILEKDIIYQRFNISVLEASEDLVVNWRYHN